MSDHSSSEESPSAPEAAPVLETSDSTKAAAGIIEANEPSAFVNI